MAGEDPKDSKTKQQPQVILPNFDTILSDPKPLKGLRVGVYAAWIVDSGSPFLLFC